MNDIRWSGNWTRLPLLYALGIIIILVISAAAPAPGSPTLLDDDLEAQDDFDTTDENTPVITSVTENDDGVDDDVTLSIADAPENGDAEVIGDLKIQYTPALDFFGEDHYSYRICEEDDDDGNDLQDDECSSAMVTIIVNEVDNGRAAGDDFYDVSQDQALLVNAPGVLSNDEYSNTSVSEILIITAPFFGEVTLNNDGSFLYMPDEAFVGTDSFSYQIVAANRVSNTARVEINVIDTTSPLVTWISPVGNGERYDVHDGRVVLSVDAQDNVGVARVNFFRWDALNNNFVDIGTDDSPPFQWDFNPVVLNKDWNQVFARSYDAMGNESERQWIWLYRLNGSTWIYLPVTLN